MTNDFDLIDKRGLLLSESINVIRSNLNSEEIKKYFIEITSNYFNADRCLFVDYDETKNKFLPFRLEKLKHSGIKSLAGIDTEIAFPEFCAKLKKGRNIIIKNLEKTLTRKKLINYKAVESLSKSNAKSDYGLVIKYKEQIMGILIIHYIDEKRILNYEEMTFLKILRDQVGMALYQNWLYEKERKATNREILLQSVIEAIRNNPDIEQTKQRIVNVIGKTLKADRCFLMEYDKINDKFFVVKEEYLSSETIKPYSGVDLNGHIPHFVNAFKKGKSLIINEARAQLGGENIDVNNPKFIAEKKAIDEYKVYSVLVFPIYYSEEFLGTLVLHYVEKRKDIGEDEVNFLNTLANQIALALHQAELYKITKIQAEEEKKIAQRERILRKIIEITRISLDISEIKKSIVKEIGEFFKADRVMITYFNYETNTHVVTEGDEYLSSNSIQALSSLKIADEPEFAAYIQKAHLTGEDIIFEDLDEYINENNLKGTNIERVYKEQGFNSSTAINIYYKNKFLGNLLLTFQNKRTFSNNEIKLLKTIADQIGVAFHQSDLYKTTKQQAEKEKAILNNLPFIAWLKDKNSKYLNVNEQYASFCGFTIDEMIGKSDKDLFPKELAQKYIEDDKYVINTGKQIHIEEEIENIDGRKWYETFKTPFFDDKGKIIGTTGFAIDITERKKVEQMKNEFISTINHELRTPLTSIRGSLGLISSGTLGKLPDKINSLLNIANNNVIRLIGLINDILDLEKIKAGKMEFHFDDYNVKSLVEETVQSNEEYAKQNNIIFKIENNLKDVIINVDKNRFFQILTNLLSNAVKYSFPEEKINISIERKSNFIRISVTNKGHGIPKKDYNKIFESFSQVDSSDSRKKGGTGLGLSISKSMVEKMGGRIGFKSVLDEKTTFYIEFPEVLKELEEKKVLICEDNKTTAYCIKNMFKELSYKADIALCAADTLELLNENYYDLMTLDLALPDKNGFVLLEEIRQNKKTKNLPVIVISVTPKDGELMKSKEGVVDWLEKSFDTEDLKNVVNRIISKTNKQKLKIFHVENDKDLLKLIALTLNDIANVINTNNINDAKKIIKQELFDVIILDYIFPEGTINELIPVIKSSQNKNTKLIIFSAYEESKILENDVDSIFLKTNVSNEELKKSIEDLILSNNLKLL